MSRIDEIKKEIARCESIVNMCVFSWDMDIARKNLDKISILSKELKQLEGGE